MDSFKKEVLGNKYLHILEITNSFRVFVMDKCSFAMSQSLPIPTKKSNKSSAMWGIDDSIPLFCIETPKISCKYFGK